MNEQETIADIIAEMKREAAKIFPALPIAVLQLATRLEAAHDHDIAIATEASARAVVGACVKQQEAERKCVALREAIDYLCERMADMDATFDPSEVECLRAALAAPAIAEKPSAVGNGAKLREAVKETQSVIAKCMDILNKIPDGCEYDGLVDDVADELCDLRDGLEAALAAPATAENSSAVGNMAAMREALETLLNLAYEVQDANSEHGPKTSVPAQFIIDTAKSALAAPARNCDVGTAEEQAERYVRYCDKFTLGGMHCETCPCCGKTSFGKCEFAWAQMPYEEQEGGAK